MSFSHSESYCFDHRKECSLPIWFVANCSSMLSLESMNGVAMIPALLLATRKTKLETVEISSQCKFHHPFKVSTTKTMLEKNESFKKYAHNINEIDQL